MNIRCACLPADVRAALLIRVPLWVIIPRYATRNVRLALDNQLVFVRTQRSDGRYAHRVDCGQAKSPTCTPNASLPRAGPEPVYLQGLYMASPAVDVSWFMGFEPENKAAEYLTELRKSLIRYDEYLWATRNVRTCADENIVRRHTRG